MIYHQGLENTQLTLVNFFFFFLLYLNSQIKYFFFSKHVIEIVCTYSFRPPVLPTQVLLIAINHSVPSKSLEVQRRN